MVLARQTLRNAAVGALVGIFLGYAPVVFLVAPLVGGAVAGGLERGGWKSGARAGAIAGALVVVVSAAVTTVLFVTRFGELPGGGWSPGPFAFATLLSLVAALGEIGIAAVGGALAAIVAADADAGATPSGGTLGRLGAILGSLAVGVVVFVVVAVALVAVLDPIVWPSVFVGLPVGVLAGAAAAVLAHHYIVRSRTERVDWRRVGVGVVVMVLVFGLLVSGLWVLGQQRMAESYDSTYEYRVSLSANESLENLTLLVPVPVENGTSAMGRQFVESVAYDRNTPSIDGYDDPPDPVNFTYEIVETDDGPMVEIAADEIEVTRVYYRVIENETHGWRERIPASEYDPDDPDMGVLDDGGFTFTVTAASPTPIATADPVGSEPLLSGQRDRSERDCDGPTPDRHRCFETEGRAYVAFDATDTTALSVHVSLEGRNEWFAGGWSGNLYRQTVRAEVRGPMASWFETEGELEYGVGTYPGPR
ncbi:MAG: DUF5518 domain-containing protein [Halanaeroarchaeum sp.]